MLPFADGYKYTAEIKIFITVFVLILMVFMEV